MTCDDILRMAREAELYEDGKYFVCEHSELERFATLVTAAKDAEHQQTLAHQQRSYEREIQLEVEAEREACAKVCDERKHYWQRDDIRRHEDEHCATAIRARGNT